MLEDLAQKLGVKFNNLELLQQAVTHRSYLNEHRSYKLDHNERLEFLGDAVLELVVTDYLYKKYSDKTEGDLTSYRSALVNSNTLSKIATELGFKSANAAEEHLQALARKGAIELVISRPCG